MKFRTIRLFIFICLILVGLATVIWFIKAYRFPPELNEETSILKNESGITTRISDFRGKYVLISYFQSWCGDCIEELEDIDALQKKVGKDQLKVLMVSDEPWEKILRFKEKYCNTLDYYQSVESLRSQHIRIFPTTFLLDKNGRTLISKIQSFDWSGPEIMQMIK